jgi:hypothetical protein
MSTIRTLTLTAYVMTDPRTTAWEGRVGTLADAERHRDAYGFDIREVSDTYAVGDAVEVHSFGRWRRGVVSSLGRSRVTVDYASDAAGRNQRSKAFSSGEIRPVNRPAPAVAAAPQDAEAPTYVVTRGDGTVVSPGDTVVDFRGEKSTFVRVDRGPAPELGKDAKVEVTRDGRRGWYYARVFDLAVDYAGRPALT